MTQQEIQERNIQIAKMVCEYDEETLRYIFKNKMWNNLTYGVSQRHHEEQLCFHLNYDWLMEAVEFIEKIYKNQPIYFGHNNCTIFSSKTIQSKGKTKKEAVFTAVSDFAKLFNNKEI